MKGSIEKLRVDYGNQPLVEARGDPIALFSAWFAAARRAKVFEPNGMVLSTLSTLHKPSARTVLLKSFDEKGFVFYTQTGSRKSQQLKNNPNVSLTFWWKEIFRQVLVEGVAKKVSKVQARTYFAKRPKGAQLAVLASDQSEPLASRAELEESFARLQKKYRGKEVPCPASWGGYLVVPDRIEFWQGNKHRLHDRLLYVNANGQWICSRLAP